MLLDADDSQLVLIGQQEKLLPAMQEGDLALQQALRLAQAAKLFGVPVWGSEQNPGGLGPMVNPLRHLCLQVVQKTRFSAAQAGLLDQLQPAPAPRSGNARSLPKHLQKPAVPAPQRSSVVLAGCEAHVCVLQTALELLDQDFEVWVVTDACTSRRNSDRDAGYDRLAAAGAELVTTEMVLFEWLRDSEHPAFKEVLSLIK
jgi:nicotinamidase-related amidase